MVQAECFRQISKGYSHRRMSDWDCVTAPEYANRLCGRSQAMLQPTTREIKDGLEAMLDMLEYERDWVVAAPQSFDFLEEPEHGGELLHVYSCTLPIFTTRPPWGNVLPKDIERLHNEEVSRVMQEICRFSQHFRRDFVVELDNIRLGHIINGAPDEALAKSHSEWRDSLPH